MTRCFMYGWFDQIEMDALLALDFMGLADTKVIGLLG
jgi:hypothetical protein